MDIPSIRFGVKLLIAALILAAYRLGVVNERHYPGDRTLFDLVFKPSWELLVLVGLFGLLVFSEVVIEIYSTMLRDIASHTKEDQS